MGDGENYAFVSEQGHGPPRGVPADAVGLDERALGRYRIEVLQLALLDHPTHDACKLDVERFVRIQVDRVLRHGSKVADVDHDLIRAYVSNVANVGNVG